MGLRVMAVVRARHKGKGEIGQMDGGFIISMVFLVKEKKKTGPDDVTRLAFGLGL